MPQQLLIAAVTMTGVALMIALWKSGRFLQALLFSAVTGNLALFGVGYLGAFTGVVLSPNLFTVGISTALGVPGVLAMLLAKLIFLA